MLFFISCEFPTRSVVEEKHFSQVYNPSASLSLVCCYAHQHDIGQLLIHSISRSKHAGWPQCTGEDSLCFRLRYYVLTPPISCT